MIDIETITSSTLPPPPPSSKYFPCRVTLLKARLSPQLWQTFIPRRGAWVWGDKKCQTVPNQMSTEVGEGLLSGITSGEWSGALPFAPAPKFRSFPLNTFTRSSQRLKDNKNDLLFDLVEGISQHDLTDVLYRALENFYFSSVMTGL